MDIVLEVLDTFVYDRLYSNILPLRQSPHTWSPLDFIAPSPNTTWASLEESGIQNYKYQPASQFYSVQPSEYAYMSRLPRDNILRQTISLYFTTW